VRLTVVAPDWLRATLREAGASRVKLSGNLAGDPFENGRSGDVFVLATRKVR